MGRIISSLLVLAGLAFATPGYAGSQNPCARGTPGDEVTPPPDLFSSNGTLNVALNYYTTVGDTGLTLFCFQTADGAESPTLHVNPGDTIIVSLTNMLPTVPGGGSEVMTNKSGVKCGARQMTLTSTNMHFHGINASPRCHSDEVVRTLINSGQTFQYKIKIPPNEPPGLYWYHPHIHGVSSPHVQGGASGAIVVEGIENLQPIVAGLPERLLVLRDQPLSAVIGTGGPNTSPGPAPFWDLSINYVPLIWPHYTPAVMKMQAGKKEFWRIANATANSILDLQLLYDGKAQPLQVVALDGVPTGSQDGKRQGTVITENHLLIPPGGRVEAVVTAPDSTVKQAALITNHIDSGPAGDYLPARQMAIVQTSAKAPHLRNMPAPSAAPRPQRFEELAYAKVTAKRKLFFSEVFAQNRRQPPQGKRRPEIEHMLFFITVDGETPVLYDPNNPPSITTTRGAVEDWIIENRTVELHEFHIHQIHFLLLEVNGKPVSKEARQFYDTYQVPYWDGVSKKYPSIKVRMDFRGAVTGDFVYHCHILDHEDGGMMAIIRVLPKTVGSKAKYAARVPQADSGGGGSRQARASR
ncbi:MAG: multicopper oxidase domain-containing protein [Alphaproteobacteria bacterium]|nr:multicopper oxidase domain-containing protein [Alphaproteobacteria bacterium]MBV9062781.1 multicopper oxidase domain-containing protein [Alphaproteobacteria bacterium]